MIWNYHILEVLTVLAVIPGTFPQTREYEYVSNEREGTSRVYYSVQRVLQHPSSPCPSVFSYEGREAEKDRWFGVVLVTTEEPLSGLRLDITLDRSAILLGNWKGEVTTKDNVKFTILNLNQKILPGPPLSVRIFVKYGEAEPIPRLQSIWLNGRQICPPDQEKPFTSAPHTSPPRRTTPAYYEVDEVPSKKPPRQPGNSEIDFEEYYPNVEANPTRAPATTRRTTTRQPAYYQPEVATSRRPQQQLGINQNNYETYDITSSRNTPSTTRKTTREYYEYEVTTPRKPAQQSGSNQNNYETYATSTSRNPYQGQGNAPSTTRKTTPRPTARPANYEPEPVPTKKPVRQPIGNQANYPSGQATTARPTNTRSTSSPTRKTTPRPASLDRDTRNAECGRVTSQPKPLVTYGQRTSRGQWPWHAAVYQSKGIDLSYICGGSLIAPRTILTAAHCVTKRASDRPVDPETLVIFLGKYHLKLWSEGGVQDKQVVEVIVHPSYNSTDFRSDLAILTLSSPVEYTTYVKPVCLWDSGHSDLEEVVGKEGIVVGWGYDERGQVTEDLMIAKMPIVSQQMCLWSYPQFFSHFTSNMTYCAGFRNAKPQYQIFAWKTIVPLQTTGSSVCNGDSGGGMVFSESQRDGSEVWRLRGLVSISVSQQDQRICDTRHFVVFTDVAKYLNWIKKYIK